MHCHWDYWRIGQLLLLRSDVETCSGYRFLTSAVSQRDLCEELLQTRIAGRVDARGALMKQVRCKLRIYQSV